MSDIYSSPEFEKKIRYALATPQPSSEFREKLKEQLLREGMKMNIDPEKKRARLVWIPAMAALVVLVIILTFTSPEFVEAMRRIFGFIPGVGLVETSSFKVLDEHVTIERDGITLVVVNAAADMDKTVVVVETSGHWDYSTPDEVDTIGVAGEMNPFLVLPDGSVLPISYGNNRGDDGTETRYTYQYTFPALPEEVMEVSLGIPRLLPIPPGQGPENWLVPFKFKPGDPEELNQVFEVGSQDDGSSNTNDQTDDGIPNDAEQEPANDSITSNINFVLDKVVELDNGFIFMTKMTWDTDQIPPWGAYPIFKGITDGNGMDVAFEYTQPEKMPAQDDKVIYQAYQVADRDFAWPLNLSLQAVSYSRAMDEVFQFDPGTDPQIGQTWQINQKIENPPHSFTIKTVEAYQVDDQTVGFKFKMSSESNVMEAHLLDLNNPVMGGGGGGGGMPTCGEVFDFESGIMYMEFPGSPIEITVESIKVCQPGDWQISWQPE